MSIFDNSAEVVAAAAAEAKAKRQDLRTELAAKISPAMGAGAIARADAVDFVQKLEQLVLDQVRELLEAELRAAVPVIGEVIATAIDPELKLGEDKLEQLTNAVLAKFAAGA